MAGEPKLAPKRDVWGLIHLFSDKFSPKGIKLPNRAEFPAFLILGLRPSCWLLMLAVFGVAAPASSRPYEKCKTRLGHTEHKAGLN